MMTFTLKKGYDLNLGGKPAFDVTDFPKPQKIGILPDKIPFIKPRLHVQEGDDVKIGSLLFEDKRHPDIKFLSPGGGKISSIQFGPRRVIQEIVIDLDETESAVEFEAVSDAGLESLSRDALVKQLLDGGVWQYIRELPFRHIARPDFIPPVIFVALYEKEPFQPQPEVYLTHKKDLFDFGVRILKKLAPDIRISVSQHSVFALKDFFLKSNGCLTHVYHGAYPVDDPGVQLYHTKKSSQENHAWYVAAQDLLMIAQFLKTGRYPIERTIALGGSSAPVPMHYRTRMGIPAALLLQNHEISSDVRFISGGIFRGYSISKNGFLGFYETSITMIPEGNDKEFLGFIRPGYHKPSFSKAFLSAFNKSPLTMTGNLHGDLRACVACNQCTYVCPVDILPQLTFKSILADEIEEALAHGLLDCVECGLCSYVCPSKIEVCSILQGAKKNYFDEQSRIK